jgi:hypothetical protein
VPSKWRQSGKVLVNVHGRWSDYRYHNLHTAYIYIYIYIYIHTHTHTHFIPPVALSPNAGHGPLILEVSRSHTHTLYDSSGRAISSSQRPLPHNTNIHAPDRIRIRNPSCRRPTPYTAPPLGSALKYVH